MNKNNEYDVDHKSEINATMAFTQSLVVMFISFYFSICVTNGQEIKLDAGPDLYITCFDEVQLKVHLINWEDKFNWSIGLQSIIFTNDTIAYACGGTWDESLIVKTTDKGKSWSVLNCPVNTFLNRIYFLNNDTGFIVGGNSGGFVLKTTNGGLSWETKYSGFVMKSIDFINDSIGFAVGGSVIKTTDGGETWNQLSTPLFSYCDIIFIDSLNGIAIGHTDEAGLSDGRLSMTSDGGKTWLERSLNFAYSFNRATHIDNKVYIATAEGMILTSEDLFKTWTINHTGFLSELFDIKFLNKDTGIVVGRNSTILTTCDGGNNWSREYSNYNGDLYSVAILNDTTKLVAGSVPGFLNNGSIMEYQKIPPNLYIKWIPSTYLSDPSLLSPNVYALKSVQYLIQATDSVGLIIKDSLNVFVTTPGIYAGADTTIYPSNKVQLHALTEAGKWELVSTDSRAWFEDIKFVNKDTGFIAGSQIAGVLLKTTDGGKTWINKITKAKYGFYELSFPNVMCGYVVGAKGSIYKTMNCGETWNSLNTNTTVHLNTIYFVNQNFGFAGGDNGTIIKTIDGGISWQKQTINTTLSINKIFFIDENRGFATAIFSWECAFFETFNGGNSWTKRIIPDRHFDITDIQFINDTIGFMIGGTLSPLGFLKTTNGGQTWNDYVFPREFSVNYSSLFFLDEFTGYVCNSKGEIIKTVDGGLSWFVWHEFTKNSLNSIYFRDQNNAIAVGSCGIIVKYHAPSDIHFDWSPKINIINEESSYPTAFPSVTTIYSIEAYNNLGCKTFDDIKVYVTASNGIKLNEVNSKNINIFPNPSTDIFYIEFYNATPCVNLLKIYNMNGKICFQDNIYNVKNGKYPIIHKLNPGLYFVEIKNPKEQIVKKIIVK